MKRILVFVAVVLVWLVPGPAFAQGQINFSTLAPGVYAPVTNMITGQRIPAGSTFLAQLFYGPTPNIDPWSLISVTNAPAGFAVDGFVVAGARDLDPTVVSPGATGTFQVRVWEAVLGSTWEQAYLNWVSGTNGSLGLSQLVQAPVNAPPDSPAYLIGLEGWVIAPVPEPAVAALWLAAGSVLVWREIRHRRL